jgi:rod shape-determining protein MreC
VSRIIAFLSAYTRYILLFIYCGIAGLLIRFNQGPMITNMQSGAIEIRSFLSEQFNGIRHYFLLAGENRELLRQNARMMAELVARDPLLQDLSRLERLDAFLITRSHEDFIPARIVDRRFDSKENALLINAGSADGVKKDMAVVTPDGLVGRVIAVSPHYARIMPVIHHDFSVSVVSDSTRTYGILRWNGENEREAQLLHVPASSALGDNEEIYTSDFSTFALRGVPVGKIIHREKGKQFYDATVRLAVDFASLHYVLVALKSTDQEKQLLLEREE